MNEKKEKKVPVTFYIPKPLRVAMSQEVGRKTRNLSFWLEAAVREKLERDVKNELS